MVAMALAESREVRGREPDAAERLRERLPSYAAALVLTLLFMGATLPSPLYVIYRHELHFSQVTLTLIYAVYFAGAMATAFFLGRISDEIGRRGHRLDRRALRRSLHGGQPERGRDPFRARPRRADLGSAC
jgi:predicted MFS family arabinose efflux permease